MNAYSFEAASPDETQAWSADSKKSPLSSASTAQQRSKKELLAGFGAMPHGADSSAKGNDH